MWDEHDDDLRRALQHGRPDLDLLDGLDELEDIESDPRLDSGEEDSPDAEGLD